jgi:RNA 2',3'-cyclic 3'-phosphodiesterase
MKRLFVAIKVTPNDQFLNTLEIIKDRLSGEFIKWVNTDNLHITLKFLGDVPQQNIHSIIGSLKKACEVTQPFSFYLKYFGYFGNTAEPKVLWIGIDERSNNIERLYQRVQNHLENIGFTKESYFFRPHLTIGRVKKVNNVKSIHNLEQSFSAFALQKIDVASFELCESKLNPTGPIYSVIEKFVFT